MEAIAQQVSSECTSRRAKQGQRRGVNVWGGAVGEGGPFGDGRTCSTALTVLSFSLMLRQQFTDFYYSTFDNDRSTLSGLYVRW